MEWINNLNPIIQTLIATTFTWLVTALGATSVFLFRKPNQKALNLIMGFASGVMLAASFYSLLVPSIDISIELEMISWLWPSIGFFAGGIFVILSDILLDKVMQKRGKQDNGKRKNILLVGAITFHNIPEGAIIGVAFGSLALGIESAGIIGAILLALGIGLQNFPEGMATALPLRREGCSKFKSFMIGQLSGIVEIFAGLLGVILSTFTKTTLPFLLSFAAGCMISVVSRELLPEATSQNKNYCSIGLIIGFIIMMVMDVALG